MSLILDGTTGVPVSTVTGTLPVANGGTGGSTSTGTGAVVLTTSPTISAPTLSGPTISAPVLSGTTTGTYTLGGTPTISSPTLVTPVLGTPASGNLANCTGVTAAALPAGSVVQVVTSQKTDSFTTSSASFIAITGLSVAITPRSATSRIFIFVDLGVSTSGSSVLTSAFRLMRDSTAIGVGDAEGSRPRASFRNNSLSDANHGSATSFSWVDSPSTTSATTYSVQVMHQSPETFYLNRSKNNADTAESYSSKTASSITVMEIQG